MSGNSVNIVADIGGTNARFACVDVSIASPELQQLRVLACADFAELADALHYYIDKLTAVLGGVRIANICLAVAGPVDSDRVDLPNNHWTFSQLQLQSMFDARLLVINDFSAQVLAVAALSDDELQYLGTATTVTAENGNAVIAALGPGTGLGVAAMLPSGEVLPSEGGHLAFAPCDEHELALLKILWQRYPRVSVERLLSGHGLENLYWANARLDGEHRELTAEEIGLGGKAGDPHCLKAIADFGKILGSVAGEVAIATGATAGVYIAGGIVPKLLPLLDTVALRQRFDAKGRFGEYCAAIPLALVLDSQPGLLGCVQALAVARR